MDSKIQEMIDSFKGRALNVNVIIRQIANENITENNLDLSMAVDKDAKYKKGIVISMGESCPKSDVEVGSTVIFDHYKASKVTLETIEYDVVFYADLLHVL